jgi:hypothetical protein
MKVCAGADTANAVRAMGGCVRGTKIGAQTSVRTAGVRAARSGYGGRRECRGVEREATAANGAGSGYVGAITAGSHAGHSRKLWRTWNLSVSLLALLQAVADGEKQWVRFGRHADAAFALDTSALRTYVNKC